MNEESDKKRKLPRHVDGRIMIGPVPIRNFFIILPVAVAISVAVIKYFSPVVFFSGFIILGILIGLASEFHQKETGFSIARDVIRYLIEGEKYFERNSKTISFHKRFTGNKIR
jgi:hypothetical protein